MPFINDSFTILDSVDSTNNYAMAKVHEGMAKNGDAFFTGNQTAGKGQRGKVWQSAARQNIALSVVIEPDSINVVHQFHLSAAVAVAGFSFFGKYAGDETTIKWPNDIYWRDRKAGGILIENVVRGTDWKWAIVGIGININQTVFDNGLQNPVSLKQIIGKDLDVITLANELHQTICEKIQQPFDSLLKEYNARLYKINETVRLKKENAVFETTIKGANQNGQLLTQDTLERQFDFGEVAWVL